MLIACHAGREAGIVNQPVLHHDRPGSVNPVEMSDCKPKLQPFATGSKLTKSDGTPLEPDLKHRYMENVGSLM
eukprot:69708-Chlamydomonas_euryale.AAC.1